jgi:hypothetical protein
MVERVWGFWPNKKNLAELPFCPENREYLGLFIDLIIEISGQKGDFF